MADRRLYLVRHAPAEARGRAWPDDSRRPLTSDGRRRMRRAARGLRTLGVEFDLILTSPFVRARETAVILAGGTSGEPRLVEESWLEPGATPSAVIGGLRAYPRARRVALVGHEPDLGELAAWLVGATSAMTFSKGAVCRFDVTAWPPRPPATLKWFATSRLLRAVELDPRR